jgi:hypothetical protein
MIYQNGIFTLYQNGIILSSVLNKKFPKGVKCGISAQKIAKRTKYIPVETRA